MACITQTPFAMFDWVSTIFLLIAAAIFIVFLCTILVVAVWGFVIMCQQCCSDIHGDPLRYRIVKKD